MRVRSLVAPSALIALLAFAPAAYADKEAKGDSTESKDDDASPKPKKKTKLAKDDGEATDAKDDKAGDEGGDERPAAPAEERLAPNDAKELPGKSYFFIGARARFTRLPQFLLNLFVAGGPPGVWIPSYGIEGTMRRDGFDTTLHLTYADWSLTDGKPFGFKGKDEKNVAWELVTSNLKLLNLGVDLQWGTEFNKNFAFQYGITTGLALVLGDLKRVQARPKDGVAMDPNASDGKPGDLEACPGVVRTPERGAAFCTSDNNHYGDYTEPSWFSGGKRPNLYASFGPQIGVRFKPGKPFMARLNIGWDIFQGPFFGLNGSYGL
jgi:hypothetical protein